MTEEHEPVDADAVIGDIHTLLDGLRIQDVSEDGTLEDYAVRLDMLKRIGSLAYELRSAVELVLIESMPESQMDLGPLRVVRQGSKRTKWKDAGAARFNRHLAAQIADDIVKPDPETGEIKRGYQELVREGAYAALSAVYQAKDVKVAARERYDIDMREFQDITWTDTLTYRSIEEEGA